MASGLVVRLDHGTHRHELHDGLLAATTSWDGKALITGGEDGKVMQLAADGTETELRGPARKWVSAVAAGPHGAVAFAEGRNATVLLADKTERTSRKPAPSRASPLRPRACASLWPATTGSRSLS
jgi:hypothetical protein